MAKTFCGINKPLRLIIGTRRTTRSYQTFFGRQGTQPYFRSAAAPSVCLPKNTHIPLTFLFLKTNDSTQFLLCTTPIAPNQILTTLEQTLNTCLNTFPATTRVSSTKPSKLTVQFPALIHRAYSSLNIG